MRVRPVHHRREQLREIILILLETIRYSENFNVPPSDLMRAVREHQLEGIVAKRAGSRYRSGGRCADRVKWRANRGQELVIGGYIPNGDIIDSLVGYYEGRHFMYRQCSSWSHLSSAVPCCPICRATNTTSNLPDHGEGRSGEGMTAAKMTACRWLHLFIVARIEFEWTAENRSRHPRLPLRSDKDAREIVREQLGSLGG